MATAKNPDIGSNAAMTEKATALLSEKLHQAAGEGAYGTVGVEAAIQAGTIQQLKLTVTKTEKK